MYPVKPDMQGIEWFNIIMIWKSFMIFQEAKGKCDVKYILSSN